MKIKRVESICKSDKRIYLFNGDGIQWIGNGQALYPLNNMPILDDRTIFTLFDIAEKDREKYIIVTDNIPETINFTDSSEPEMILEHIPIELYTQGITVEPLKSSGGILFVETRYLAPFSKQDGGYELYERTSDTGLPYIAVKSGLFLIGVIFPTASFINEEFMTNLNELLTYTTITYNSGNQEQ